MSNTKIDVLDHGFVRLVNHMGDDLQIVRSARVSFDADWRSGEDEGKDSKLIGYLLRNKHTSPFESVVFTFEICCPLFVARQWHRHRTWSYNEVSARYTQLEEKFYIPKPEDIGQQSASNKQARDKGESPSDAAEAYIESLREHCEAAYDHYQASLSAGIPRELARAFLPLNCYTRYFGTVDLHNLMHFLRLRDHEHAQYEIRVYAQAMKQLVQPLVPITMEYFEEHK